MPFPVHRPRRIRLSENFRRMVRETHLAVDNLIYPMFVVPGQGIKRPIQSMPGINHFSVDLLLEELKKVCELKIPGILLFGIPQKKDDFGSESYDPEGIVQQAIRAIKSRFPDLLVITDICMCEYTAHGHCGIIKNGQVDNDRTLEFLAKIAVSHAEAGADMLAPSDMMDGRVSAIRKALDERGYSHIPIMSYAAKYASSFYGPFRQAAESTPQFGDRRGYQMDVANAEEALRECALDLEEGADIIMVKPALGYLDIIYRVKSKFSVPVAAYNVSGEYAMIKAAAGNGWIDETRVMMETLISIKRAGADIILTYFAKEAAFALRQSLLP
ncbi:MAG: porphobilinogen synthase [bacterium]|nr:porphobilinogen synthase [bacterium]